MILLHLIVALVFGFFGAVYAVALDLPIFFVFLLYQLCGSMGLLVSICVVMVVADMSQWSRKQAQRG